jgi:hypothetical protein
LICETFDDKGNVVVYAHAPEDSAGVDGSQAPKRFRLEREALARVRHVYIVSLIDGAKPPTAHRTP